MNIEIANRLVQLRKEKNLSQEALANALGISRQAVSKWERAEASPDTDNLILLARLYGVSLDELLKTDQTDFESSKKQEDEQESKGETNNKKEDYVHIGLDGIHVKERGGDEVYVGWKGIHVHSVEDDDVDIDKAGVFINGEEYNYKDWSYTRDFPVAVLVSVVYIYIGIVYGAWHPGWLIFGIIPLFHTLVSAIRKRDILRFAFPILIFMIIGYYGFIEGTWYPYWLLCLTIPVFYSIFGYLKYLKLRKKEKSSEQNTESEL